MWLNIAKGALFFHPLRMRLDLYVTITCDMKRATEIAATWPFQYGLEKAAERSARFGERTIGLYHCPYHCPPLRSHSAAVSEATGAPHDSVANSSYETDHCDLFCSGKTKYSLPMSRHGY